MANRIIHEQHNVNLRQDVCDLIEGESLLRNNGEYGFSLTVNQIILEYFSMRTPQNIAVKKGADGKAELTIDWNPTKGTPA
ncbi:hypothetical protein D4S03_08535 [bacterium]|nr:MAG: hypothetical protein D4S03_08535 [bacterium]